MFLIILNFNILIILINRFRKFILIINFFSDPIIVVIPILVFRILIIFNFFSCYIFKRSIVHLKFFYQLPIFIALWLIILELMDFIILIFLNVILNIISTIAIEKRLLNIIELLWIEYLRILLWYFLGLKYINWYLNTILNVTFIIFCLYFFFFYVCIFWIY